MFPFLKVMSFFTVPCTLFWTLIIYFKYQNKILNKNAQKTQILDSL